MFVRRAALAALVLLCTGVRAQEPFVDDEGNVFLMDGDMLVQSGDALPPGLAPGSVPTPRLQKLQQVEYDRRPSAILAAWSTPPKPEAASELSKDGIPDASSTDASSEPASVEGAADAAVSSEVHSEIGVGTGATGAAGTEPVAETDAAAPADPAAAEAAAKAAEAAKAAAEAAARMAAEAKAIEAEIAALQRNVTLGDWAAVKSYLAGLTDDEKKVGYERMLGSLKSGPMKRPNNVQQQGQPYIEKNRFSIGDVLGLAAAAPLELSKENLQLLGQILRQALDAGHQLEAFLAGLRPTLESEDSPVDRRELALILVGAGRDRALEGLLPTEGEALAANDRVGLNLLSRYYLARYAEDSKPAWLEHAWEATQAALGAGEIDEASKSEAIQRAVDIAPKIKKELGKAWLDESFTARPERGMEILAAIGTASAQALQSQPTAADNRLRLLELQTTAAEALLGAAPERAGEWKSELALLAGNWLREALVSYELDDSSSTAPRMQRDYYGNFYYNDMAYGRQVNLASPIRTTKILDIRPSDAWLARIEETFVPRFQMAFAQLYLKVGEEAKAFPYIESLAETHPDAAEDLVAEFLRVWAKNHDPNTERQRTNQYMYMYGFEQRANGIPLTRSKQERNLRELGECIARLRRLPVKLEDELLATAFRSAHSQAEVYRLETIEQIFGPLKDLDPGTLAGLLQSMRGNLVTVWRDPAVQEKAKTNRHQKEIQTEVLRGYDLARATIDRAIEDHPESWALWLARAAFEHDENAYRHELGNDSEFSARREHAFETFAKAAGLYAAGVDSLEKEKESSGVYETWFYAALGACDLSQIDPKMPLAERQIPLVRAALESLPAPRMERHRDLFANTLFTRMSNVGPAIKFRYVREGLAITGDHELVREARSVFDYYNDLVTEIQLVATIDGSDRVGSAQPFGLRVDLRHTREIERESGGFAKYLQNQNSQSFGWNYGRPLEDYRDKFEEATREALQEHFEVLSVTFEEPDVGSRADTEYGWRVTPYAYVLMKPRGPQVDRVPGLRLDLDFLDTTGYAVLPVESAVLPIDAGEPAGDERPYAELALTQTLDERQAKDGKLVLDVKATAHGLVPGLATLLDLAPGEFEVTGTDDHGVSVVKFDDEGDAILSERTWTITMRPREGLTELPESFAFGTPLGETTSSEHFRYVDADLATVGPTVRLENRYGKTSRAWMWGIPAVLVAGAGAIFGWRRLQRPRAAVAARFSVPEPLTPFSVLGLLRDIHTRNGLAPEASRELAGEIATLERHYFDEAAAAPPDLRHIAQRWVGRAT